MNICVVGLGYIGLPTAIMFAKHGVDVFGVDVVDETLEKLNNGIIHLEEPGLQEEFTKVLENKKLTFGNKPKKSDVYIVAVPTPNNNDEHKSCDLSIVKSAVASILPYLSKGNTIIVESTIAPRSMDDEIAPMVESEGFTIGEDLFLVHCPERVLPGKILHELVYNNRIVGGITKKCTEAGKGIYQTFVKGEIILTNSKTAEMSKLMENTFRDVNIALANELVKICTDLEVNALDVIDMANKHPRVNLHQPGPGVGGHCLAVDPYFIVAKSSTNAKLIKLARDTNNSMPDFVVENIKKLTDGDYNKVVTLFGLTYKGNVDDIRESPAMDIKKLLETETNYEIRCYDPHVDKPFVEKDISSALKNSDLVVILSDHNEFKDLSSYPLHLMNSSIIFDTKNMVKSINNKECNYVNFGNIHEFIDKNLTVKS